MDPVDIINNMESEFIYQTPDDTRINTDIMESKHIFKTFNNHIYHSTTDFIEPKYATDAMVSKYTFETFDKVFMNNNSSVVEPERIFDTFSEACATIEQYATQTNAVVILDKTTRNSDNSDYIQATFVCEKQGNYNGTNEEHTTKHIGCPFAITINYCKCSQKFAITKSKLEHSYKPCLDAVKFSTVERKFDKDDLGLIEKLHDDELRTKDIFSVLNSIEMLFKTLYDDENILGYTALKAAYNTERDQDGEFVQGIFWAYPLMKAISKEFPNTQHQLYTWHIFKNIRSKLKKLVDIEEFIKIIQKLVYDNNLENDQIDQEIAALWKQFPKAKTYILHSKLKGIENRVTPVDKLVLSL
ncbi:14103_t:CDS:2 [Racocetra fulgida]|uniref:14103_t:CDS:1 n=1 Tax=Racocetra fulgida TaxID=60492 RepID=A0A9N8Z3V0_9GLOM|nr:14103_t:CDS:2 [Racocetra fulgida]